MRSLIRETIAKMHGYVPGEQPTGEVVKLNTNENAHPPSPRVMEAIQTTLSESARRYPDPLCKILREALAEHHGVDPEKIFVGNGSDEVLRLLAQVTLDPGDGMAFLSPTYSYYEVLAALFDARAIEHALGDGWQWPDSVWRGDERIFFIANPNPPVGTLYPLRDIARLCESRPRALVVVDEAYIAFAGEGSSAVPLLSDHSNLVVTRTFSKSHQLAGLRVGYALAHRDVLGALMKAKDSYNVNAVSQAAARAAIRDAAHFDETRRKIVAERRRLVTELSGRGFVIPPSEGNFLFAQHPRAPEIFAALRDRHIYVRWFDRPRTRLGLRITVGLPQQIDALLAGLDEILSVESPVAQSGR